jgi:hypothetical protein
LGPIGVFFIWGRGALFSRNALSKALHVFRFCWRKIPPAENLILSFFALSMKGVTKVEIDFEGTLMYCSSLHYTGTVPDCPENFEFDHSHTFDVSKTTSVAELNRIHSIIFWGKGESLNSSKTPV